MVINRRKSQTFRGQTTTAQFFRRFPATAFAHRAIKQSFTRNDVFHCFDRDGESWHKKRRKAGYGSFLNFQICVHDIAP
jgi:phosphoribulokinase